MTMPDETAIAPTRTAWTERFAETLRLNHESVKALPKQPQKWPQKIATQTDACSDTRTRPAQTRPCFGCSAYAWCGMSFQQARKSKLEQLVEVALSFSNQKPTPKHQTLLAGSHHVATRPSTEGRSCQLSCTFRRHSKQQSRQMNNTAALSIWASSSQCSSKSPDLVSRLLGRSLINEHHMRKPAWTGRDLRMNNGILLRTTEYLVRRLLLRRAQQVHSPSTLAIFFARRSTNAGKTIPTLAFDLPH